MLKVNNIDHVAIAVSDLAGTATNLAQLFGLGVTARETVSTQKTDVVFLFPDAGAGTASAGEASAAGRGHGESCAVELICPSGNEGLERFLAKRGPGLHHICFAVDDLAAALAALKASGVPLIDEVPRPGARGHLVGFIHPKATGGVLFELCQKVQGEPA